MTPREAKTLDQIYELPRDHVETRAFWFLLAEDTVTIAAQENGAAATATLKIPRRQLEKFIDWYNTGKVGRG